MHDEFKPNFDFKSYHDKIRLRNAHKCLGLLVDEKISLMQTKLQTESAKDNTISENEINEEMSNKVMLPNENSYQSDTSKLNLEDQIIGDQEIDVLGHVRNRKKSVVTKC